MRLSERLLLMFHQDRRVVWSDCLSVLKVPTRVRELTLASAVAGIVTAGTVSIIGPERGVSVALLALSVVIGLSTAASP